MNPRPTRLAASHRGLSYRQHGIVLPVVLVLLVVMSFVGLLAARRSATVEEISNNARVNQVAWLSAETALRYCEAVVIDRVEAGGRFDVAVGARVQSTQLTGPEDNTAAWRDLAKWDESSAELILVPVVDADASATLKHAPAPRCIAQAMQGDRYLVTARGLSVGATFNASGQLVSGAEVWLQSTIAPEIPLRSAGGGYE